MVAAAASAVVVSQGCTFIIVFGLPGYKHENDSAHALFCGHNIYNDLASISNLRETSIGITTGLTYCGVVGHPHRHEYTVIGPKVNLAARLMQYYPGKASFIGSMYWTAYIIILS